MYMNQFSPTPLGAQNVSPMDMYAHGGHLHHAAEQLRHFGMGRDKILAHINPAEASYLFHNHGMSMNPHTGLPQFGLYDMLASSLPTLGGIAGQAYQAFGKPLLERGLGALDTRIQQVLPSAGQYLGQKLGGQRFGEQFGQLGQSLGGQLAGKFNQYGGFSGQVLPRIDQRMGVQGPSQFPSITGANPMQMARDIGRGVYQDAGRGMASRALQGADERIMNRLGNVPGIGGALQDVYGNTSGMAGYAMPRINRAVMGNPPASFAHGGYATPKMHHEFEGGSQHLYPHYY